jgi:hypothetical protein
MAGLLAEGTLYLNRELNSVPQGWKQIPGVATFSITNKSDIKDQISKDKGTYGQITASVAIPKPSELKLTISNFDRTSLSMALMGDDTDLSVGGGTVADEVIVAHIGSYVDLAHRNLTAASVVLTNSGATVTYIENTDYRINYALGMMYAITGGAIADAASLKIDYLYGAIAGFKVSGSTKPQINGAMRLDGRNLADGKALIIDVDRVLLVSDTSVDFMSDKFVEIGLSGRMETLSGKTTPYTVESY